MVEGKVRLLAPRFAVAFQLPTITLPPATGLDPAVLTSPVLQVFRKAIFDEVATGKTRIVRDLAHSEIRHWESGQQVGRLELGLSQDEPVEFALKLVNQHQDTWKVLQSVPELLDLDTR